MRANRLYNGQPPYGLRGYIGDGVNRIMGYAVLRQIRVKPNSCRVKPLFHKVTKECANYASLTLEDTGHYCDGWGEYTNLTNELPSCVKPEFKYTTAAELNSLPYNAYVDIYGGGGYVFRIKGSDKSIKKRLNVLREHQWVNNHTRALMLEFSVYNANVNLFGIATIIAEFIPGGGIFPYWRFEPVRLLHHHESFGSFILLCEIIFVIFFIYFAYREIKLWRKEGFKEYWSSYWSYAEWGVILMSFVGLGIYIVRYVLTNNILSIFRETYGNGYVKLQYVGILDEYYGYILGSIIFICNLKFIKLLKFNKEFSVLILTLRSSWEDLYSFLSIFFLTFFAFVQLFYMILHTEMRDFSTLIQSLETCFTMMLNKFKFGALAEVSITASVMFFFFVIACNWILINVMLTIIIEAFERVKVLIQEESNQYELFQFIKFRTLNMLGLEYETSVNALKDDFDCIEDNEAIGSDSENDKEDEANVDMDTDGSAKLKTMTPEALLKLRPLWDKNITELPSKINIFVQSVNNMYLDGKLEFKNIKWNQGGGDPSKHKYKAKTKKILRSD